MNPQTRGNLCALIVIADAESALSAQSMGPEATEFNVGLGEFGVGEEEPEAKDWFGEDVKDGIGKDFLVDAEEAGSISHSPNDWVGSPDEKGVEGDGGEEFASLAALCGSLWAAIDNEVPDDEEVGDAGNGVPAPFLGGVVTICGEEAGQDHDEISEDEQDNVAAAEASQKGEVEEEQWGGQAPVDIASPEDLAVDVLVGVWDSVLVVLSLASVVVVNAGSIGHCKVRNCGNNGDQSGDNMVETARHWNSPGQEGEYC